ncbi:hypothetical protein, partial [Pseudomonas sp. A-B-19]|uniref:hypothetical protein n=1 Tax=Pseudomonas sp. A-B-19 TaxID=2832405 RepID=UPI001CBFAE60
MINTEPVGAGLPAKRPVQAPKTSALFEVFRQRRKQRLDIIALQIPVPGLAPIQHAGRESFAGKPAPTGSVAFVNIVFGATGLVACAEVVSDALTVGAGLPAKRPVQAPKTSALFEVFRQRRKQRLDIIALQIPVPGLAPIQHAGRESFAGLPAKRPVQAPKISALFEVFRQRRKQRLDIIALQFPVPGLAPIQHAGRESFAGKPAPTGSVAFVNIVFGATGLVACA